MHFVDHLHHARSIDWPAVQRTRVAPIKAYNNAPQPQKAAILKDVVVILLHSVTPPGDAESAAQQCPHTVLTARPLPSQIALG